LKGGEGKGEGGELEGLFGRAQEVVRVVRGTRLRVGKRRLQVEG
jgi:hypothetical protein